APWRASSTARVVGAGDRRRGADPRRVLCLPGHGRRDRVGERRPGPARCRPRAATGRCPLALPLLWSAARRLVEAHGGADQRAERVVVDRLTLVEVDGAAGLALEARVEET